MIRNQHGLFDRITCPDGFSISVQAHTGAYSAPRDSIGPYWQVECGYPEQAGGAITAIPGWEKWADAGPGEPARLWGYVPVREVIILLRSHGWTGDLPMDIY